VVINAAIDEVSENTDVHRSSARPTFHLLDTLRGIAALLVVIWHTEALFGIRPGSGYLAVDFFFVLSGFVIAHSYDRRLVSGMSPIAFMRVRLIRLYPLYIAGIVIAAVGIGAALALRMQTGWKPGGLLTAFVYSMLFLPTPPTIGQSGSFYPLDTPAWSLSLELLINFLFAISFRWQSIRVLIGVISASLVLLCYSAFSFGSLNNGFLWSNMIYSLPRVFFSFSIGVMLLRLYHQYDFRLHVGAALPVILIPVLLCLTPQPALRPFYDLGAVIFLFPLITLAAATAVPRHFVRTSAFLGIASYAIYVLHVPLMAIAEALLVKLFHRELGELQPWAGIVFLLGILVTAWLADKFYDLPVRRWLLLRFPASAKDSARPSQQT
jgi:peptidoglycan/LPS O-acetylase OafA/YrhL